MKRPELTKEEEEWICYKIGQWYIDWKDKIVSKDVCHRLGVAKEELKKILCNINDYDNLS